MFRDSVEALCPSHVLQDVFPQRAGYNTCKLNDLIRSRDMVKRVLGIMTQYVVLKRRMITVGANIYS